MKRTTKAQFILLVMLMLFNSCMTWAQGYKTRNVILVTLDGMRWQEVFTGADSAYFKFQSVLKDPDAQKKYWSADAAERRKALFPFLWTVVESKGQVYGNRLLDSKVNVTNQMWFSYPGYNELLTGVADDEHITSNDKTYNPNETVLEFINKQGAFKGKVAAYTSWEVFPFIINDKRSGLPVSAGLMPATGSDLTERERTLNALMPVTPNPLGEVRLDAFTFYYGLEYLKKAKPRVLYFSFDETDDFAHAGEYAAYLNSAHSADGFLKELWDYIQSDADYKNKTTLIVTVDHGRGIMDEEWKDHGRKITSADQIWFAIIGPDTPPTGEQRGSQYFQNQLARTITTLLGLKYEPSKKAGDPIQSVFRSR